MADAPLRWYAGRMMTGNIATLPPAGMETGVIAPGNATRPVPPSVLSAPPLVGVYPDPSEEPIWMIAAKVAASS